MSSLTPQDRNLDGRTTPGREFPPYFFRKWRFSGDDVKLKNLRICITLQEDLLALSRK